MKAPGGLNRNRLETAIYSYVLGRNAERNRNIFYDKMVMGLTHETIAEKYDLSVTQVKRIVYKCEQMVFKHV